MLFPGPPTVNPDQVAGFVDGRVTDQAQFGAIGSVTFIFVSVSFHLFVTRILNTAFFPVVTAGLQFLNLLSSSMTFIEIGLFDLSV